MTDNTAINKEKTRSEKERDQQAAPIAVGGDLRSDQHDLLNDTLVREYGKIKNELADYRHAAIHTLPGFIVNNSTNLLGAAHVATEMAMFKSALPQGTNLAEYKGNPFTYAFDATKEVFGVTFKKSIPKNFNLGTLKNEYGNGNTLKGLYNFVTDTKAATERAMKEQGVTSVEKLKLSNPWQARTTMCGLGVWGLSTLIPDKKDTLEEIEHMTVLQQTNPIGYIGERMRQAIDIPHWHEHKRQMIGLGYIGVGLCSTLGSWRGNGVKGYSFNKGYFMTSMFSLASAIPLLFATDDEKGFGGFGALMMGRLFFLPGSIARKFSTGEPGAAWYGGASVAFQIENYMQTLFGGAEKKPDGTVVDHQEIMKIAKRHAQEIKRNKHRDEAAGAEPANDMPTVKVQHVAEHTPPTREAAHAVS